MSVRDAATELGLGVSTLRTLIRAGSFPVVRLGRRVLVRREALERYVRSAELRGPARGSER